MKRALVALALLGGCTEESHVTMAEGPPVGRYQALPFGETGKEFVLLDTQSGVMRRCWTGQSLELICGAPTPEPE